MKPRLFIVFLVFIFTGLTQAGEKLTPEKEKFSGNVKAVTTRISTFRNDAGNGWL